MQEIIKREYGVVCYMARYGVCMGHGKPPLWRSMRYRYNCIPYKRYFVMARVYCTSSLYDAVWHSHRSQSVSSGAQIGFREIHHSEYVRRSAIERPVVPVALIPSLEILATQVNLFN